MVGLVICASKKLHKVKVMSNADCQEVCKDLSHDALYGSATYWTKRSQALRKRKLQDGATRYDDSRAPKLVERVLFKLFVQGTQPHKLRSKGGSGGASESRRPLYLFGILYVLLGTCHIPNR